MGGGDSGSCCSYGGARGWFYLFIFFRWWWPAVANRGFGFAKKVVGFQRRGESQIRRERKKREKKIQRIKKQYLNGVIKK